MHWKEAQIHVIDFEGSLESGVLEYGLVSLKAGKVCHTETALCQATGEIHPKDARQHGIRAEQLEGALPFSEYWERFNELRQSGPFGAHHASVENNFLKKTWPYPNPAPDFLNTGKSTTHWGPFIDTCQLYRVIFRELESYSLMDLIRTFGLERDVEIFGKVVCPKNRAKHHCALYDAFASARLLIYLGELEGFEDMTVEWLLENSRAKAGDSGQMELGAIF